MEETEVDISRFVSREPGREVGGFVELAFVAEGGEGVEAADHDGEVEDGEGEVGPEGFGGLRGLPGLECAVRRGVEGSVVVHDFE